MTKVTFKLESYEDFKRELGEGVSGIWGYSGSNARKYYEMMEPLLWAEPKHFDGPIVIEVEVDDLRYLRRALNDAEMSVFISKYCRPGASITRAVRDSAMFNNLVGSQVILDMIKVLDDLIYRDDHPTQDPDVFYQIVFHSRGFYEDGPYFKKREDADKFKDAEEKDAKRKIFAPFRAVVEERKFSDIK